MKNTIAMLILFTLVISGCSYSETNRKSETKAEVHTEATLDKASTTAKANAYILAFDSVWKIDAGLNSDIKYVSINTKSFMEFSEQDKKLLFDYVAKKYHVTVLDMSIEELKAKGYVKSMAFTEGIVFEISKYFVNSSELISFEGMKWRSGLGAIGFTFVSQKKAEQWKLIKCDMTWIS